MMPLSVVPVMGRPAGAVTALGVPARPAPIGFFFSFFGFDFRAEFLFFGVSASACFAFVVDFFDRDRFVFTFVVPGFVVVRFGFVVFDGGEGHCCRGGGKSRGVGRGGRGEQHQRSEQEDQQDRQFAHGPLIGDMRGTP
jgi:hypothetical protein